MEEGEGQASLMVSGKESACSAVAAEDMHSIPGWVRKPKPVFLPGESHGERNLAGYSP